MRFSDSKYCLDWLEQFDSKDTLIAKTVIDSMWFVSSREVDIALWKNIDSVLGKTKKSSTIIALYTTSNKKDGSFGSEHKVGYLLEHFKEFCPFICIINPPEHEVISGGFSHIVIVEDIVGSGQTLYDFCKKIITPKIKSKLSTKKIELHISCFCAYAHAIRKVLTVSKSLNAENFHACICLSSERSYFNEEQLDFLHRARSRTSKKFPPLGFRKTGCPVIFEYSCPNNTPAILHDNGLEYMALFPKRKIPSEVRPLFNDVNRVPAYNLLTSSGGRQLGEVLDLYPRDKSDISNFVIYLRLISKGVDPKNLQKYTIHSSDDIQAIMDRLRLLGLLQPDGEISKFGEDLLKKMAAAKPRMKRLESEKIGIYIPDAINNIRRGDQ